MNDKQRLEEAKRLIFLAMDQLSRVADSHEGQDLGNEAEDLFHDCEDLCESIDSLAKDL